MHELGSWQDDHAEKDLDESQTGSFWTDARNDTDAEKLQFVLDEAPCRQLTFMTAWCRISTLELPTCDMKVEYVERLAGVLAQCPALSHLDLNGNSRFGTAGAERLAGVLTQCQALAHLDLSECSEWYNEVGNSRFGPAGAKSLAGVLAQCPELTHLNLSCNHICDAGAEIFAGVLAQCPALAQLTSPVIT